LWGGLCGACISAVPEVEDERADGCIRRMHVGNVAIRVFVLQLHFLGILLTTDRTVDENMFVLEFSTFSIYCICRS
jgi:hypothetical protein